MRELIDILENMDDFSAENQEKVIMKWIKDNAYHLGNVMNAFRLALVGEGKGPHIFDITVLLGKEETVSRLKKAVETIPAPNV
jgi:glutamyl-tRNA synthetase